MYARIAHFAGIAPGRIDEQVAEMKRQSAAARSGDVPTDTPAQVQTLMETVTRFLYVVDRRRERESGSHLVRPRKTCVVRTLR